MTSTSTPVSSSLTHQDMHFDRWIPNTAIATRTQRLATELAHTYRGQKLRLIAVLHGAQPFHAMLTAALAAQPNGPSVVETDTLIAKSYHGTASGQLRWLQRPTLPPAPDVHVVIVEDIVDSGRTISAVTEWLQGQGYASVAAAVLLNRPEARDPAVNYQPQFVAFEITDPQAWAIGFGMDLDEQYRELPDIYGKRHPGRQLPPFRAPTLTTRNVPS
jgi:hypoxanthine phosphoribosyltransferase